MKACYFLTVAGVTAAMGLIGQTQASEPTFVAQAERLGTTDNSNNSWLQQGVGSISGNPAAGTESTGTGWLGRTLRIPQSSGITLGGIYLADTNGLISGGAEPGRWSWNSLFIVGMILDAETTVGWKGASFGVQFLQFNGQNTNGQAGSVQGYNSLVATPPFDRSELYQVWYLQEIIPETLQIRIGRMVPTDDFNNVMRPNKMDEAWQSIPAVTALLFTPVYVNSAILGAIPGYYNSGDGITVNFTPGDLFYLNYGLYDGNLARGVQTGLTTPSFNGYYFNIWEAGLNWALGEGLHPGKFGVGLWYQTGVLTAPNGVSQNGTGGFYLFGSQQVWARQPTVLEAEPDAKFSGKSFKSTISDKPSFHPASISVFWQYGKNNSETLPMNQFFGLGATGFGLIPFRPQDSLGLGMAWSWLNPNIFDRSSELMFQTYYQAQIAGPIFLQPTLSYIPTPGAEASLGGSWAMSLRMTVLF